MMQQYFTDEELDTFMKALLAKYPDALERAQIARENPFDDDLIAESSARNSNEIADVAKDMPFFKTYAARMNKEFLEAAGGKLEIGQRIKFYGSIMFIKEANIKAPEELGRYYSSSHLESDVSRLMSSMLGPIGSYEIEE